MDSFYYGQDAMTKTPMYATAVQASHSVIDWNSKADAEIVKLGLAGVNDTTFKTWQGRFNERKIAAALLY